MAGLPNRPAPESYTPRVAFPKHLLNQDEELILDLRPHWLFLALPTSALAASVILGLLVTVGWSATGMLHTVASVAAGLLVLVALVWFGWTYLKWTTTNFVLTSHRILTRRGVFSKQGKEIPLASVVTVIFHQSFLERLAGAGDLGIESAGEHGTETLTHIRKPSIVQKEIYVQMEANENAKFGRMHAAAPGSQGADATTPQPPAADIPGQIDKLAELHARGVLSDAEFTQKKAELLDRM